MITVVPEARSLVIRRFSSSLTSFVEFFFVENAELSRSGLALTVCLLLLVGFQGTNMLQGLTVYAHTVVALLLLMNYISFFAQQDHMQVFKFVALDCLDFLKLDFVSSSILLAKAL